MSQIVVQGIGDGLSEKQRNAIAILTNLSLENFNNIKAILELGSPGILGLTTLNKFMELCAKEDFDLSNEGINAFKDKYLPRGNKGSQRGVIGATTAETFYKKLIEAINRFPDGESAKKLTDAVPFEMSSAANVAIPKLLAACEAEGVSDPNHIAYIMATVQHECNFKPIREIRASSSQLGLRAQQDRYWFTGYFGRGYVQLTWRDNYEKFGHLLNVDLLDNPDLALNPDIAAKICVIGMNRGLFTGSSLVDFDTSGGGYDFFNARKIVNWLDRATLIEGFARNYRSAL